MPAQEKSSLNQEIPILGIVAGGGVLPERLAQACESLGVEPFIVAFEGHTDMNVVQGRAHMIGRMSGAGSIIKTLRAHNIKDLVLIGAMRRPHFSELRPDLFTAGFIMRLGMRALGDSDMLSAIRADLEKHGFTLHGVHEFINDLLMQEGVLGRHKPTKADWVDIERGMEVSQKIGALDVGQSVIVQGGVVLGVEAVEGTDELIRRCGALKRKAPGGVLVKTCKPQQDRDFDLPTIGPDTINNVAKAGLAGIAIHAGDSLLIDPQKVAEIADRNKMFVIGVDVGKHVTKTE
ncbi:MAG: hypothetical protein DHS20C02_06180 [Micavibrio sp.]|nr:MAG: hypothetical protein DHS20C02_06180 [Micavibrio sp.]